MYALVKTAIVGGILQDVNIPTACDTFEETKKIMIELFSEAKEYYNKYDKKCNILLVDFGDNFCKIAVEQYGVCSSYSYNIVQIHDN